MDRPRSPLPDTPHLYEPIRIPRISSSTTLPSPPVFTVQPQPSQASHSVVCQWMSSPQSFLGCPPGLEFLNVVQSLLIQASSLIMTTGRIQKSGKTSWEKPNQHVIRNASGEQMYTAYGEMDPCVCFLPNRGFEIVIEDRFGRDVVRISRGFRWLSGCCWLADSRRFSEETVVESPPGNFVGAVRQRPKLGLGLIVLDLLARPVLEVEAPPVTSLCTRSAKEFPLYSVSLNRLWVGSITKLGHERCCEDSVHVGDAIDKYQVELPPSLDVRTKAAVLGAVFELDFLLHGHDSCCCSCC